MSDGRTTYEKTYGEIYKNIEFVDIPMKYAVRILKLKKGRIKILNKFEINHRTRRDPLKAEIEAVEQFKDSGSLALYTDTGFH